MKILWLCNIILPSVAEHLGMKPSNKEGWLSGVISTVSKNNDIELAVSFPVDKEHDGYVEEIDGITYYGFYEDTVYPENYDPGLEERIGKIVGDAKPDAVHIFGTEFPHTLAMCNCMKDHPEKVLVGLQGIMRECTAHYTDGLPEDVKNRRTFRDILKKDSIKEQCEKFNIRSDHEEAALKEILNVTGRTEFDRNYINSINPAAKYFSMNETLRKEFYSGVWNYDACEKYSIFLSQGNYPIKGVHYVFEALPEIKKNFPGVKVYIAGDVITAQKTIKDKIKISSYGKYLLELIKKYDLAENVVFTGNLDAEGVKERLLKSNLFICPSTVENSPNSLGEAMLLGVPSIAAEVGGIPSIFEKGTDGIMYPAGDVKALAEAVKEMFENREECVTFGQAARAHALKTHDPETNYSRLLEIYKGIGNADSIRI